MTFFVSLSPLEDRICQSLAYFNFMNYKRGITLHAKELQMFLGDLWHRVCYSLCTFHNERGWVGGLKGVS